MALLRKKGIYDTGKIVYIASDSIKPNKNQPRRYFDREKLKELSDSIAQCGIIQPLSVRKCDAGYELIAGERRLRAAKMAGLREVPCIILDVDTCQSSVLALVENIHRQNLDFIEEAEGIYQMIQVYGLSRDEVAKRLGKSQSAISNKLRLLKIPGEILFIVRENGLTERHARALLRLEDDNDKIKVLEQIISRDLNVAATEKLIDKFIEDKNSAEEKSSAPVYIIKDIRLFLNTITHGMDIMKKSGIFAEYGKDETENDITVTIKIPKNTEKMS